MSDFDHEEFESLRRDVRLLTDRVAHLETCVGVIAPAAPLPVAAVTSAGAGQWNTSSAVAVMGKALLALAGAYMLRALTESGSLPVGWGVALGIAYSALWLALAAHFALTDRVAAVTYGLTSVLVLAPLLWEATVRFHAIQTWVAAGTLAAFTILGLAISWHGNLTHIAWIATLAGVFTSAALLMATHDVLPFTCVFLAVAAAVEVSACFEHWLKERFLVAMMLDLAVLLVTWLASRVNGLPEGYAPIPAWSVFALQAALLTVYLASAMARTLWRNLTFTNLEVFQCAMAFAIGVGGGLRAGGGHSGVAHAFAMFTLVSGAACYLVSFSFLERRVGHGRNFYIYSTFGLLLTVAGGLILLPSTQFGALLPMLAIACVWLGGSYHRKTLLWHGVSFVLLGAFLSQAFSAAWQSLLSNSTGLAAMSMSRWLGATGTILCGALILRYPCSQAAVMVTTLATALVSAGMVAGGLTGIPHAEPAFCSTIRTAVLLASVLLLAWNSRRHPVFSKVVWVLMALGAYKLLTQEVREERTLALVVSLALYGATLLLLPRLMAKAAVNMPA
ncbi:MAG: hypothetical protein HY820_22615 [Acidobacteria bacterium]|nr:hypothetical protein [Acidobacteriota bacterium]